MAAYAALVTLSKAIHQLLPFEQHYSFLCDTQKMQSLLGKVNSLQQFLEHISGKSSDGIDELESRIRDVAHKLEDIVESILVYSLAVEYQDEVNSRLSIQGAKLPLPIEQATTKSPLEEEGRAISRKSNAIDVTYTKASQTSVPSTSDESDTKPNLDDILGWCLDPDHDFKRKAKYSHFPLISLGAAAAFGDCIEEADLVLKKAVKMKKIVEVGHLMPMTPWRGYKKFVKWAACIYSQNIATTSFSRGPPDANDTMVGLKDDLHQILGWITRRQPALEVIPITGMGGIGKTTLARAVYDHHRNQAHFDLVLWATVSHQYNVKDILRMLCLENAASDEILSVHQRLKGRRYLIILDDVWDKKVWDSVRIAFPDDNNYSRIILTTRLSKVATYVSSSCTHAHQMQLLNEEQSWDLLRETVYGKGAGCPNEFEDMGRIVSRSCKGLPLALVVIGGLLKVNTTSIDYWADVLGSTTTEAVGNESILKIMSLSYRNLAPHLKACFLYFGMFPEDKEIPTKELVRLWCAEGFLKPRESKTMEVVAEECLEELVERNLILVKKKRYNGKIKTSSIHDVLRDLSLIQAQKEKFLYRHDGSSGIDRDTFLRIIKHQQRRVCFPKFNPYCSISLNSPVRTFRFESSMDYDELLDIIPQFKLLRVCGTIMFPSSDFGLNNLRYLHLIRNIYAKDEPSMVPKSISKLRNLETLFVSCKYRSDISMHYDLYLPVEIWEMPRLRHLVSQVNVKLPPFPALDLDEDSSIESSSLETLTGSVNFVFTQSVVQKLQNLKKLKLKYIFSKKEFGLDNLVNLHHLEDLTIYAVRHMRVTNIGFPSKLKKLRLEGACLPWEKMTPIGDLIHLEVLKLDWNAFVGRVWEPIEGGFPQLKYLKMDKLWSLEEWRAESTHFPSLEKLVILNCKRLKEVPGEIGDIDTLQKLIVQKWSDDDVGRRFEESVRMIEDESVRAGNDSLQVIIMSKDQYLRDVDR